MPNHCYCTLTIEGPHADLVRLRNRIMSDEHGHPCLLASLLPMPEALKGTRAPSPLEDGMIYGDGAGGRRPLTDSERGHLESLKAAYGHADWYSWQNENWGMKWGDCNTV